jgi:hypothetical protein
MLSKLGVLNQIRCLSHYTGSHVTLVRPSTNLVLYVSIQTLKIFVGCQRDGDVGLTI